MTTTSRFLGVIPFIMCVASGCATLPPSQPPPPVVSPKTAPVAIAEVTLMDAELTRKSLLAKAVIAAPRTIVSDLNALSDHLSFPIKLGNELRSRLISSGDPSTTSKLLDLADRLDPLTPTAIVWLLGAKAETRGFCTALTFLDATQARASFGEFGREQSLVDGISERLDVQGHRLYLAVKGRTLLVANTQETLRSGGGLAMETRLGSDQVMLSFWPEVFMRVSGLSPSSLAALLMHRMDSMKTQGEKKMTPALRRVTATTMEALARFFTETQMISLGVNVGLKTGIELRGEVLPRPSTGLAEMASRPSPYVLDLGLPIKNDGTWLGAWGEWGAYTTEFLKIIRVSGPAGEKLASASQNFSDKSVGNGSCTFEFSGQPASYCSHIIRSGVSPQAALDALIGYFSAMTFWTAELDGRKAHPIKVKRSRNGVSIERKIESTNSLANQFLGAFFGGNLIRVKATAKDGKLLLVQSGQAGSSHEAYKNDPPRSTPPILAHTLTQTAGADFMFSMDPASLVLNLLPKVKANRLATYLGVLTGLPGIESLHIPLVFSWRSGGIFKGELQLPLAGIESLGNVMRGVMGPANQ